MSEGRNTVNLLVRTGVIKAVPVGAKVVPPVACGEVGLVEADTVLACVVEVGAPGVAVSKPVF